VPFLVKHILDGVFTKQDAQLLWTLPGVIVVFALVRGADSGFGRRHRVYEQWL
jgi:hypothetical protein